MTDIKLPPSAPSEVNPERIMVLGDSHGNLGFVTAAMNLAHQQRAGVVHVVGDFGFWTNVSFDNHGRDLGKAFLDAVQEEARALDLVVTFTDGNHENFDDLYAIPVDDDGWRRVRDRIWHAPRGHIWRWGAINMLSMGGAHSIDGPGGIWRRARDVGRGWWPQETITDEEVHHAIMNMAEWANETPWGEIDVLFAHDAPSVTSLPFDGYPAGDQNRARLQQVYEVAWPQLLVHGHYHVHQQFHDRALDSLHVALAADMNEGGQYMFIDTDPFEVVIPRWQ